MKKYNDFSESIFIEEVHHFDVELSEYSHTSWEKGQGKVRVAIPYDGHFFNKYAFRKEEFQIGELKISFLDNNASEGQLDGQANESNRQIEEEKIWPIKVEAGEKLSSLIKSGQSAICELTYKVNSPRETVLTIDGKISDYDWSDEGEVNESLLTGNGLHIDFDFWLKDILPTDFENEIEEVERLTLQKENIELVFLNKVNDGISIFADRPAGTSRRSFNRTIDKAGLQASLIALANSYGGTIVVGVRPNGKVVGLSDAELEALPAILLDAALTTNHPIPVRKAEQYKIRNDKSVFVINVGTKRNVIYGVNNQAYKREKANNIEWDEAPSPILTWKKTIGHQSVSTLLDPKISVDNQNKCIVVSASKVLNGRGVLGEIVCRMINPPKIKDGTGTIIVLDIEQEKFAEQYKKIRDALKDDLVELVPVFDAYSIQDAEYDEKKVVQISLNFRHVPVALFKKQAFIWKDYEPSKIPFPDLLNQYINPEKNKSQSNIDLVQASVDWAVSQPDPTRLLNDFTVRHAISYSVQSQKLYWKPDPDWNVQLVSPNSGRSAGYNAHLSLPLDNVAISTGEPGIMPDQLPELRGHFEFIIDDIVLSGIEVERITKENQKFDYFQRLPIKKQTRLILNVRADLDELFKHRRLSFSELHFSVSDSDINSQFDEIMQICADCGIRIYQQPDPNDHKVDNSGIGAAIKPILIRGIRSSHFHDIQMLMLLTSEPSMNTREMNFEDVKEITENILFKLKVDVWMYGSGEGNNEEIIRLQLLMYELISERLQRVGMELG